MNNFFKGYFVLAGTPHQELIDDEWLLGNHTRNNLRGAFGIHTEWSTRTLNIPSRDKQVMLWADENQLDTFASAMEFIDSHEGPNYRAKLRVLLDSMPTGFRGVINNLNVSTHGSIALLGDFHYLGVFDQQQKTAYLIWDATPFDNQGYFGADCEDANRYLLYRFPLMPVVFLPSENICAKWRKWSGAPTGMLLCFNALERRLCR